MNDTIQRVYFTIPEVASKLGIAQSHVRHYIKEFGITPKGTRYNLKRLNDDQVILLGIIHYEAKTEGRKYSKIKQLLKIQP